MKAATHPEPRFSPGARRLRPERSLPQAPLPAGPRPDAPLPDPSDWTFDLIEQYHEKIRATAARYALDTYPNQLEVITAEQMMDAYASIGMPVNYRHWSYGWGAHRQRAQPPARPDGAGLRDRDQFRSLHQLPHGGEHDRDAGARHRPRGLRAQQLLQGQPSLSPVDRRVVDRGLPAAYARNYRRRVRREVRHDRGRRPALQLAMRCRTTASTAITGRARSRSSRNRRVSSRAAAPYARGPGQLRHLAHLAEAARSRRKTASTPSASRPSRRKTSSISSRRTRRCSSQLAARDRAHRAQDRPVLLSGSGRR